MHIIRVNSECKAFIILNLYHDILLTVKPHTLPALIHSALKSLWRIINRSQIYGKVYENNRILSVNYRESIDDKNLIQRFTKRNWVKNLNKKYSKKF